MALDPRIISAAVEAAVPVIAGGVLTARLMKQRRAGARAGVLWIGPLLLLSAVSLMVRPFVGPESQSLVYQTTKGAITSRDVATLTYNDFLGTWEAVVDGQAIRRRLSYTFAFKPDGDCTLDYVSFNLDTSAEVKHFYDMKCEVSDGTLTHAAKDPSQGEQYEEAHKIDSFDDSTFAWSDEFVGPIRYRKRS